MNGLDLYSTNGKLALMKFELPDDASDELKDQNALFAEQIAQAMREGEDIEIKNAIIAGDFILNADRITGRFTIKSSKFTGRVDWSYSVFSWVMYLEGCEFEGDAVFDSAKFCQDVCPQCNSW